ncbi:acyl-CoA N-acyltransferase [Schizophyllum commune]|nr:acyl-CoA N-acyltransferase [Schizophyllum commune Loenen D]
MFTTQRLQLRAFTDDDYVNWTSIWNDPANQALFSEDLIAPMTSLSTDELRRRVNGDRTYMLYLSITIKSSGEPIGCVTATKPNARSRQSSLAVMISKDHRWFGCNIEAIQAVIKHCFEVNAIHRVSLSVFASNQIALKYYKELGFIEEGKRRAVYWKAQENGKT